MLAPLLQRTWGVVCNLHHQSGAKSAFLHSNLVQTLRLPPKPSNQSKSFSGLHGSFLRRFELLFRVPKQGHQTRVNNRLGPRSPPYAPENRTEQSVRVGLLSRAGSTIGPGPLRQQISDTCREIVAQTLSIGIVAVGFGTCSRRIRRVARDMQLPKKVKED